MDVLIRIVSSRVLSLMGILGTALLIKDLVKIFLEDPIDGFKEKLKSQEVKKTIFQNLKSKIFSAVREEVEKEAFAYAGDLVMCWRRFKERNDRLVRTLAGHRWVDEIYRNGSDAEKTKLLRIVQILFYAKLALMLVVGENYAKKMLKKKMT